MKKIREEEVKKGEEGHMTLYVRPSVDRDIERWTPI